MLLRNSRGQDKERAAAGCHLLEMITEDICSEVSNTEILHTGVLVNENVNTTQTYDFDQPS